MPVGKGGLSRELGLFQLVVAGVGIILGAGIYALIGVAAGIAGNAVWLAFIFSAIVALFTGLSYAELSSMFKRDAAEYDYVHTAFNKPIAIFIGYSMILAGAVTAAAVSLGFAGYFTSLVPLPYIFTALLLVLVMSGVNCLGIKEMNLFNLVATLFEAIGLLAIILLGFRFFGSVDYFAMPHGIPGLLNASALVFFAFLGFESIVKFSEETKNPQKTIPKALLYSVVISSILYILVAVSAISILGWENLSTSKAPLASVAAAVLGPAAFTILGIIALFSTSNTVLLSLVTASRQAYGMAEEKSLPKIFSFVHPKMKTPLVAIILVMVLALLFALIGDLELVASITNLLLFVTFAFVNLSLLVLRYKCKDTMHRSFKCPVNIGEFSVIALLGFLSSVAMIVFLFLGFFSV